MKKVFIILLLFISCGFAYADSINPAVYKTMSGQSYSTNYRLNTRPHPTPYWQTQANPATRNNYLNNQTQRFNQDMSQYRYNMKLMRGY